MKKILYPLCVMLLAASCNNASKGSANGDAADSIDAYIDSLDVQELYDPDADGDDDDIPLDISELPETAERMDAFFQYAVYVNVEQQPTEDEPAGIYSVWTADERTGTCCKVLTTNPRAEAQWEKMKGEEANALKVGIDQIAVAERAWVLPDDVSKIIVEGCPDGRNIWTYLIDTDAHTAKQFPTTEGLQQIDAEAGEIILSYYGYYPAPDYGRYTCTKAYDYDGNFVRVASEKEPE